LNETPPHFMTQELYRKQCIHWRPQKFFQGGNVNLFQVADDAYGLSQNT